MAARKLELKLFFNYPNTRQFGSWIRKGKDFFHIDESLATFIITAFRDASSFRFIYNTLHVYGMTRIHFTRAHNSPRATNQPQERWTRSYLHLGSHSTFAPAYSLKLSHKGENHTNDTSFISSSTKRFELCELKYAGAIQLHQFTQFNIDCKKSYQIFEEISSENLK